MTKKEFITSAVASVAITWLFLLLSTAAHAEYTSEIFCNHLADMAEAVALDRDNGAPQYLTAATLIERVDPGPLLNSYLGVVEVVYIQPYLPPSAEAGMTYIRCIEMMPSGYES